MIQIGNIKQAEYSSTQQDIKSNNTRLIFNLIRDHMPVSRIELSRMCSLSTSTVSKLVDALLERKWVIETESVVTGARGRRSVSLAINEKWGYVATVELLSRGFICTLYNICLKKVTTVRIRDTIWGADSIAAALQSCLYTRNIPAASLIGIHLIYPGVVDEVSGDLISSTAFPGMDIPDRHLVILLQKRYPDAQVMISTNGTIIAYEEFMVQKDYTKLPLLSLNIDEAIFGGVVLSDPDNNMTFCFPVEIGHIILDRRGSICKCGNRGCMETLCATPVLFKTLHERTDMRFQYSELFGSDCNVTAMKLVAERLKDKDPAVGAVLRDYSQTLCSALISVVNFISIRSIHIGGDLALLGDPFLEMLREVFWQSFYPVDQTDHIQIDLFSSDYEQVRLAAGAMCLDRIFLKFKMV